MRVVDLCGRWEALCIRTDKSKFEFAGSVPGSAINDLINAKMLPQDIFWRDNSDSVSEFEKCDYVYKKEFDFGGESKRTILQFERIDTYADVFLNGIKIYHSENGNISHEIDVTDVIAVGKNVIEVHLYSPSEWVKELPLRKGAFTKERLNTRRMQCTYGWDWVARFLTCGLGNCCLCMPENFEIFSENVYIATMDADAESATVRVDMTFPYEYEGRVFEFLILKPDGSVACRTHKYCKENFVRIDFDVPEPRLWYPLGYGEQPLYTFAVNLDDKLVYSESFGIRTVKIMQIPDSPGSKNHELCLTIQNKEYDFNTTFSGFVLKINGEKVFCKGANWVPCVPFSVGNIDARQTEILELCAKAGVNMLRVWGGGAFESRHFYDECSRLGIMVTQDFLMACGSYPEEQDWFIAELKKEALYAARLCRNKPCLMWWSGDNENAVNGCDTDDDYRGRRSAYEGIAPVLYREDPYRRFLPSSPYGGNRYASNTVGTTHNTQFLGQMFPFLLGEDLSNYKDEFKKYRARFIAEEPQLGAVSLPSLRRFMSDDDIFNGDFMWYYHTKDNPGLSFRLLDFLSNVAEKILGAFADSRDRLFKLQYVQYEWVRVLMEQARRGGDFCSGIIFWMMNDCWPAASGWSLIDYYNLPKIGYYAFKRCAKPILCSLDYENGKYALYISNNSLTDCGCKIELLKVSCNGAERLDEFVVQCMANESTAHDLTVVLNDNEILIAELKSPLNDCRAFYKSGELELEKVENAVEYSVEDGKVILIAKEYVHAVVLEGEAIFEDNGFSMLKAERKVVPFRYMNNAEDKTVTVETYTLTALKNKG